MMKFPPSRAVYIWALVLAVAVPLCAVLVVAQGQRRAAAPRPAPPPATPLEAATRLFFEGKFDDLDSAVEKLDARDPAVVALKARAMIARGKYAEAEAMLQPVAQRAPSSEAALELGLLQKLLGRLAATQTLERVASLASSAQNAVEMARAARALQALDRVGDAKSAFLEATRAAPNNAAIESAFGDLFLEKYNYAEAMKSYERVLELDPRYAPALLGAARALENDDPPQAAGAIKRLLQINPSSVDAHIFLASQAADVDHTCRGARTARQGAGRQPLEPRGAQRAGRAGVRRGQAAGVRRRSREGARDCAGVRRRLSRAPANCSRTTTASRKRWR